MRDSPHGDVPSDLRSEFAASRQRRRKPIRPFQRVEGVESEGRAGIISEGQTGIIGDPLDYGVLDPAAVKREAVESATEAATMIVRIDDVIAAE